MKMKLLTLIFFLSLFTSCKKDSSPSTNNTDIKGRWVTDFVYRTGDDTSAEPLYYDYVYDFLDSKTLWVEKYKDGEIRSVEQFPYTINGNVLTTEGFAFGSFIFFQKENKVKIITKTDNIIEFERDYFYRSSNNEYSGKEFLRLKRE